MSGATRQGLSRWAPWPLAIAQVGALTSIASFGPVLGALLCASVFFSAACLASSAGFTVVTLSLSHLIELPGLSSLAVFALKWAISGIVLGVVVARFAVERKSLSLHLDTAEVVLVLFALWCAICSMFAIHRLNSFAEAMRIAVYPLLVVVVRETLTSRRDLVVAILAYAVAAAMSSAYSASAMSGGFERFSGFTGNANVFGLIHSFIVPVLVSAWFVCRGFLLRLVLLSAACMSFAALMLSWSRASVLSAVVQGIVIAILFRKFKLLLAGAIVCILTIAAILAVPDTRELVFAALRLQAGTTHRTLIWEAGLQSALASPLVGHGFGLRVGEVVPRVNWGDWGESFVFKSNEAPFFPHNLFIFVLLTSGMPGLILFLALAWLLCRRHFHAGRAAPTEGLRVANFTIVAMVIGALANGIFEGAALIGKGAINNYFWIAVGIVAAYDKIERHGSRTVSHQ